jgi:prepilin-type N-terminal cleavage/methylation domain-containing protein
MKMNKKGFTLIELMIVVAIIGILAAIAIPKFADLISKSKEGATKGSLSSIRSALQIYYGDNEGAFPGVDAGEPLDSLTTDAKYLSAVPEAKLPGTGKADSAEVKTGAAHDGSGGWHYYNDSDVPSTWGNIIVNCDLGDLKDVIWSTF